MKLMDHQNVPTSQQSMKTPSPFVSVVASVAILLGLALVVQYGLNFFLRDVTFGRVHITYGGTFGLLVSLYVIARMVAVTIVGEIVARVSELLRFSILPISRLPNEKESDR